MQKGSITQIKLGGGGRLANKLFGIASVIGIAKNNELDYYFNDLEYSEYFKKELPKKIVENLTELKENHFHVDESLLYLPKLNFNVSGYLQSEKYFSKAKAEVKKQFEFKEDFVKQVRRKFYSAWSKRTIAIHIRRGDYVNNINYHQLPINYFITALLENFPNWQEQNIVVLSDDISYCKVHFDCLKNVFFSEGNSDIEDLCLMSQCDDFILSNSSYSWWGGWLGEKKGSKIVRPAYHFEGGLKDLNTKDFWPERWVKFDHQPGGIKILIDLSDTTFTIPVAYDHKDRKQNLDLCVCMLQHHFRTNIIVGENKGNSFEYMSEHCDYVKFNSPYFHRTKMLNDMARMANTSIVANWDADVIVSPLQLWLTVDKIRKGADMAYPYEWAFARVPRLPWFKQLEKTMDIGIVGDKKFNGMNNGDAVSVGGAVLFNKESFFNGGGENENFVSFGPEDAERFHRFKTLGYEIKRTMGPIYHINHWVGPNSSNKHLHVAGNRAEWSKISNMNANQLLNYVQTFKWIK